MNQSPNTKKLYFCPMYPDVHQPNSGKCQKCGMLRHMIKNPLMVIIMMLVMVAIMAMIMMMRQ